MKVKEKKKIRKGRNCGPRHREDSFIPTKRKVRVYDQNTFVLGGIKKEMNHSSYKI